GPCDKELQISVLFQEQDRWKIPLLWKMVYQEVLQEIRQENHILSLHRQVQPPSSRLQRRRVAAPPRRAPDVASTAGVLPLRRAQRRQSPPAAVAELPAVVSPSPAVRRQSLPSAADDGSPRHSTGRRLHCRRPSPPSIAAPPVAAHRRRAAATPLSPASVTVAASSRYPELISPAD
ncbi:unnamed protein product, partial [Cuscuta campestris]